MKIRDSWEKKKIKRRENSLKKSRAWRKNVNLKNEEKQLKIEEKKLDQENLNLLVIFF